MVRLIRNWFSKTERSFFTLVLATIVVYKIDDHYHNLFTNTMCMIFLIIWASLFSFQMYNVIRNR
jgi:hypothetical protein